MTTTCKNDSEQACPDCEHDLEQHDYSNDIGWRCYPRQVYVVDAPTLLWTEFSNRRARRAEIRAQRNERRTR